MLYFDAMEHTTASKKNRRVNWKLKTGIGALLVIVITGAYITVSAISFHVDIQPPVVISNEPPMLPSIDTGMYDRKMLQLANIPVPVVVQTPPTKNPKTVTVQPVPKPHLWPVLGLPYPNAGALLPFNRIVAFYGNFYSKSMGILGQYDPDVVLQKLAHDVKDFEAADPATPVVPAIHYIVTTAQRYAGADGKHILRMPAAQIQKAIDLAQKAHAIVFLDVQTGSSTVEDEVPLLAPYLKLPQVHLGIDPEFSVKSGEVPGKKIGTIDASDINWVIEYLAKIVRDEKIPPKILVIHRFTKDAVTNYKKIKPLSDVQVVMNMDGWGSPDHKITTYHNVIYSEPVQFTGFKVFYGNDLLKPSNRLMTPSEILKLQPIPIYIQYQ